MVCEKDVAWWVCSEGNDALSLDRVMLGDICESFGLACFCLTILVTFASFGFVIVPWMAYNKCNLFIGFRKYKFWSTLKIISERHPKRDTDSLRSFQHHVTHLGIIMDGNRRYGRNRSCQKESAVISEELRNLYKDVCIGGNGTPGLPGDNSTLAEDHSCKSRLWFNEQCKKFMQLIRYTALDGHRLGGEKLIEFIKDCIEARIEMLTVYAFSTDNWNRPAYEVETLMTLFFFFFDRIRSVARGYGIFIRFVSTNPEMLPKNIYALMKTIECESRLIRPRRITVNVCVSYSGQSEIVAACNRICERRLSAGNASEITKQEFDKEMLRSITQALHEEVDSTIFSKGKSIEPQLILRTSGEQRISNFLLYECAYSELFFFSKTWPEITREDLSNALVNYSKRNRRLGK